MIGKGVNMGNALEAPFEGSWGVRIEDEYFEIIKKEFVSSNACEKSCFTINHQLSTINYKL